MESTDESEIIRNEDGTFKKGHSGLRKPGNPNNKKSMPYFRKQMQVHCEDAINEVVSIAFNPDSDSKEKMAALKIIIEYSMGKPIQMNFLSDDSKGTYLDFLKDISNQDVVEAELIEDK